MLPGVKNHAVASAARTELECHSSIADRLLSRLEHVERHGSGWRARCPTHGSDRNRSLAIAIGEDGRVLLNCFAGCNPAEFLRSIGLEFADLFPKRITHNSTLQQRRELRQAAKQTQWAAALKVLAFEARVIAIAGDQISKGEPLSEFDYKRLLTAVERAENARMVFRGK